MEDKLKAFTQHILQECEKEGFSVWEVERLPQAFKLAIGDSVTEQTKSIGFSAQSPTFSESSGSDGCNH